MIIGASAPRNVDTVNATAKSFYVKWEEPLEISGVVTSYIIRCSRRSLEIFILYTNDTTVSVDGLGPNAIYKCKVPSCKIKLFCFLKSMILCLTVDIPID